MYQITLLERDEMLETIDEVLAIVENDVEFPQKIIDRLQEQRKVLGVK